MESSAINMIVIDDIRDVVDGIVNGIEWDEYGITIAGACLNGEEGLELALRERPDIIITDIRMPKMDGLTMTRAIVDKLPFCKIILISGYSDFEYAQEAIRLGAFDFVTKPFSLEDITDTVQKARNAVLETKRQQSNIREMERRVKESLPVLRQEFFNLLIRHKANESKISDRWDFLQIGLDRSRFVVMVLEIDRFQETSKDWPVNEIELLRFTLQNILEETIHAYTKGVVFRDSDGRFVIIYNEYEADSHAALAERCCEHLATYAKYTVSVGVGNRAETTDELPVSYQQAVTAMSYHFYTGGNGVVCYSDVIEDKQQLPKYPADRVQDIAFALQSGNRERTLEILEEVYEELIHFQPRPQPRYLALLLHGFANMLVRVLLEKLSYEDIGPLEELLQEMETSSGGSVHDIYELLKQICEHGCTIVEERSASQAHLVIERAIAYIKQHLSAELTVAHCASQVHLSGSYFANLFKKVTGMSFNQYVTATRMEKAKEMLLQNKQIQEIASALGYEERRYFSDVFKKVTGMTPSEFRQSAGLAE
ncbi:response regulator [Paenibacillus sp. H1-7]|uniref:response regulator transcription factor n=1 Tax=Paenibacillus sp. H1-7 TaxID=2282849 RepID=UPI001EF9A35A|nr:response regulator [Paenibacillus sp. H1-7]